MRSIAQHGLSEVPHIVQTVERSCGCRNVACRLLNWCSRCLFSTWQETAYHPCPYAPLGTSIGAQGDSSSGPFDYRTSEVKARTSVNKVSLSGTEQEGPLLGRRLMDPCCNCGPTSSDPHGNWEAPRDRVDTGQIIASREVTSTGGGVY